ncbi:MAG: hypothetical protein LBL66_02280, partial [Clostridiales bacterium]|nr:hypothetical protein [Clostridiales bacterium]
MVLYLFIIGFSMAAVFAANGVYAAIAGASVWAVFGMVWGDALALFLLDALFATAIHFALPKKWFDPYRKIYRAGKRERRFYNALRIVRWKDKIPETGKLIGQFDKTKVAGLEADYLFLFLRETCYAEIIHYAMLLLPSLIVPLCHALIFSGSSFRLYVWTLALPCAFVNFALQIPPIFVQRFNRPRLLR